MHVALYLWVLVPPILPYAVFAPLVFILHVVSDLVEVLGAMGISFYLHADDTGLPAWSNATNANAVAERILEASAAHDRFFA